jgi:hypothetical protein
MLSAENFKRAWGFKYVTCNGGWQEAFNGITDIVVVRAVFLRTLHEIRQDGTIKKKTQTLIDASKEEKTKYMLLSRHQNAGQNHDIKIGNRYFENVAQFRYLGMTITN